MYPVFYKDLIDAIVGFVGTDRMQVAGAVMRIVVILTSLNLLEIVLRRVLGYFGDVTNLQVMDEVAQKSFKSLFAHSEQFFADTFVGSLTKKMSKIFRSWLNFRRLFMYDVKGLVLGFVFPLAFLWIQASALGWVTLARAIAYSVMLYFLQERKSPSQQAASLEDSALSGSISDIVSNHQTVRYFGATDREFSRRQQAIAKRKNITWASWRRGEVIRGVDGIMSFIFDSGIVAYAAWLRLQGQISAGVIVMVISYSTSISGNLRNLAHILRQWYDTTSDAGEMVAIMQQPVDIADVAHARVLEISQGRIDLEHVTFSYRKKTVIDDMTLSINPGEKIGLVGLSGAGKSTFIKLLLRLYDVQQGSIAIDGQDIATVQQETVRSGISMVPQDVVLFHRTLHDNISYARPDATREEVIEAAKLAHCHDFIEAMPDGYDTTVGERGVKLSGGERQRVAIARAILAGTKIVILDEATSSLDSQSEKLIQDAIHVFLKKKTAIVVAHRLSTIMEMDRIIVMNKGKIAEQGTHAELLAHGKIYKKLRDLQTLHH